MIRGGEVPTVQPDPEPPTLASRILDLSHDETEVFMGLVAGHFAGRSATSGAIDRETAGKYVDEAVAVTK